MTRRWWAVLVAAYLIVIINFAVIGLSVFLIIRAVVKTDWELLIRSTLVVGGSFLILAVNHWSVGKLTTWLHANKGRNRR